MLFIYEKHECPLLTTQTAPFWQMTPLQLSMSKNIKILSVVREDDSSFDWHCYNRNMASASKFHQRSYLFSVDKTAHKGLRSSKTAKDDSERHFKAQAFLFLLMHVHAHGLSHSLSFTHTHIDTHTQI